MQTLVFDGRTGAAGDMICAALIAAGADPAVLEPVSERLPIRYEVGETTKNGIRATTVDVLLDTEGNETDPADAGNDHTHDHDHTHNHTHTHAEGAGVTRSYPEVVALVESMELSDPVESAALDAFERLGRAEASIHGTDLDKTHFHEVGADDAIADIVGAALLLDDLGPDRVVTTPVAAGNGEVTMAHGVYPVPAPATTEIATRADFAVRGGPVEAELLTPTGAAILGAVAEGVDSVPDLDINAAGYGAGDAIFPKHPNVLRVLVGDGGTDRAAEGKQGLDTGGLVRDDITVLETNLDDATPEVLGGLHETLSQVGARDVTVVPTTMKKSRPGHLVKVICRPDDAEAIAEVLARETGTLGVRQSAASHRWIAERAFDQATLSIDGTEYEVSVKIASVAEGDIYDISAEYDDAAAVAEKTGLAVREVLRRAETRVHEMTDR